MMEELTAALSGAFEITKEPNKTSAPHPRYSQYKEKVSKSDQEARRKALLTKQKSQRFDYKNHVRKLTEDDWNTTGDEIESADSEVDTSMDIETTFKKPGRYFRDQLMLSEWLVEVPTDFLSEWLCVLCPVAKRCLIVASRGRTRAFTKSGYCLNAFPSHLPGGHYKSKNKSTILDCVYSEVNRTYYILDIMCWNGFPVYDSETEFRFYWLHEKLQEAPTLSEISKSNPFIFVPLPSFRCEVNDISAAVSAAEFEIDGLLFFHKRTHYTFGSTPLVVWLKPYMLPEILGISVPDTQMTHMPEDYSTYANHMKKVEDDLANSKSKAKTVHNSKFSSNNRGPKEKSIRDQEMKADVQQESSEGDEKREIMEETVDKNIEIDNL